MRRNWVRVIRRRGWLLLGVPLLTIILLFILLDHFLDVYLISLDEAGDLERRISQIEQMKTNQPRLQEVHQLLKPQYEEIEARSFKSTSSTTAVVQMESSIKNILQSLYFDEIEIKQVDANSLANRASGIILLEVNFAGVPQQLNRLESALAVNEYAIRVNKLDVLTENNIVAGAGNIRVQSQFLALYLPPAISPLKVNKSVPR